MTTTYRIFTVTFLAALIMTMPGCANFDNSMAGSAVDIPDDPPMKPAFTAPTPSAPANDQAAPGT